MNEHRFKIDLVPDTEAAAEAFSMALDRQIDEMSNQLNRLQVLRRALGETFGIDRREGEGRVAQMRDAANRGFYEGEHKTTADGKLVPPGEALKAS